jgi:nucleotide-binding universal stress UspA family protein
MRIVVGVDGSAHAAAGLATVAALDLAAEDEVILVAVAEPHERLGNGAAHEHRARYAAVLERTLTRRRADARRVVERARGAMRGSPARLSTLVLSGHPAEVLASLGRERSADLLVVGTRGRGVASSMLLGSVAQSLLAAAGRPVLVARPGHARLERILVAVDGSPHGAAALATVAVLPLPPGPPVDVLVVAPGGRGTVQAVAGAVAEAGAAELTRRGRAARPHVRSGQARREILRFAAAETTDLVVLGARGLGGFLGLAVGSVPRAVVASAPCSVLVVPGAVPPTA